MPRGLKGKISIVSATFGLGNEQVVLAPEEAEGLVVIYPYFQELDNATNKEWVQRAGGSASGTTTRSSGKAVSLEASLWALVERHPTIDLVKATLDGVARAS